MKTQLTFVVAFVLSAAVVQSAGATAYNWVAPSFGGWKVDSSWSPVSPVPDYLTSGGDTFFAGSGALIQANTHLGTFGAQLTVGTGAHFRVVEAGTVTELRLDGGIVRKGTNFPRVLTGNVYVDSDSILDSSFGAAQILVMSTQFHGTANLTVEGHDDAGASIGAVNNTAITRLNQDSSLTYSGDWNVTSGILQLNSVGALGDGTGSLSIASGAKVEYLAAALTDVTVNQLFLNGETFLAGAYDITQTYLSTNSVSINFANFFLGSSGETVTLTFTQPPILPVPEPSTLSLLGLVMVPQLVLRRRKSRVSVA